MIQGIPALMISQAKIFNIRNLPGIRFYLDARFGVNLVSGEVDVWQDQTINANDFSAPTSGDRVFYNASYYNGKPYVYNTNTTRVLKKAIGTQDRRTISIGYIFTGPSTGSGGIIYGQDSPEFYELFDFKNFPTPGDDSLFIFNKTAGVRFLMDNLPHVVTYVDDAFGMTQVYIDGVFFNSAPRTQSSANNDHVLLNWVDQSLPFIGGINSIVNCDNDLSGSDLTGLMAAQMSFL